MTGTLEERFESEIKELDSQIKQLDTKLKSLDSDTQHHMRRREKMEWFQQENELGTQKSTLESQQNATQ